MYLLSHFLRRLVKHGALTVIDADGRKHRFGQDDAPSDVVVRIDDPLLYWKLVLHPELYLGEAYMDGTLVIEQGSLWDLLELCGRNLQREWLGGWTAAITRLRQIITQYNPASRSTENAAHHYDLPDALFESFLDSDRQYSCAYFTRAMADLEEAQAAKKRHIAAKLLLRPNLRILDIGCGWGGLALELAALNQVNVHGITLSREQYEVARRRARESDLTDRVHFSLMDYRNLEGQYDRIISVGMFEHVGTPYYRTFFDKLRELLAPDGVALLHSIGRMGGPGVTSAWLREHIFPGGYVPALSEVLPAIEREGLWVTDVEILRLHYAYTLRYWRDRFLTHWNVLHGRHDASFRRKWEFYLAAAEMGFRYDKLMVFQIQLAREMAAVPITRDYIYEAERILDESRLAAIVSPTPRTYPCKPS